MVDKYIRDSERLGLELRQQRRAIADVARPTGTELNNTTTIATQAHTTANTAHTTATQATTQATQAAALAATADTKAEQAGTKAEQAAALAVSVENLARQASSAVESSQAAAREALELAAAARETAAGKNRRVRGSVQPETPAGGWVKGDQWVKENSEGTPVSVKVWNGSQFVDDLILADSVLVPGSNGGVRLADGVVTANTLNADALNFKSAKGLDIVGGSISGGSIVGGSLALSDAVISETGRIEADGRGYTMTPRGSIAYSSGGDKVIKTVAGRTEFAVNWPPVTANTVFEVSLRDVDVRNVSDITFTVYDTQGEIVRYIDKTVIRETPNDLYIDSGSFDSAHRVAKIVVTGRVSIYYMRCVNSLAKGTGLNIHRNNQGSPVVKVTSSGTATEVDSAAFTVYSNDRAGHFVALNNGGLRSPWANVNFMPRSSAVTISPDLRVSGESLLGANTASSVKSNRALPELYKNDRGWFINSETVTLSAPVSEQLTGVVFAFSAFSLSKWRALDEDWNYVFVPKWHAMTHPGDGVKMQLRQYTTNVYKHVFLTDTTVTGVEPNGHGNNRLQALRAVLGV